MGGRTGDLYARFCECFVRGFLELRPYRDKFVDLCNVTSKGTSFPCFARKTDAEVQLVLDGLRGRFKAELSVEECVRHCMRLINDSASSSGTANYDRFQYLTQGTLF